MLRSLKDTARQGGFVSLSLVFALAFAAYFLANAIASVVVFVFGQHVNRAPDAEFGDLSFHIGDTRIDYASTLQHGLALTLLAASIYWLWRGESDSLRECPACLSDVPSKATVCRYCTSELAEDEPA
jgi:large conductance mechanosensitive channel